MTAERIRNLEEEAWVMILNKEKKPKEGVSLKKWRALIFSFFVVLYFVICTTPKADVIGNFDTGGNKEGPKGKGSRLNYSINGDFGIRFSLVDKSTGRKTGKSIDYFKIKTGQKEKEIIHSVVAKNKIEYLREGFRKNDFCKTGYLDSSGGYAYHEPALWNVIYSKFGNKASREDIKTWLNGENQSRTLADKMGVDASLFSLKEHRLIIEPVFYFTLNGEHYGLTAHEIALWDDSLSGAIRKKHVSRSHKNIPVSLYLKRDRFGFKKHDGSVKVFDNESIQKKLGIGVIGSKEKTVASEPKIKTFDYVYRCDTEVYTGIELEAGSDHTPDDPMTVIFDIPTVGRLETGNIYVPKGYKQSVWVKWRTPKTPMEMDIRVSGGHGTPKTIKADVIDKIPWEPQNPRADDRRPLSSGEFRIGALPKQSEITGMDEKKSLVWSRWEDLEYHPYGDFVGWDPIPEISYDEGGNPYVSSYRYIDIWDMDAYWSFGRHSYTTDTAPDGSSVTHIVNGRTPTEPVYYTAKIIGIGMEVNPADTCRIQNSDNSFVKSGYGIEADIDVELKGNGIREITGFQTAKYYFPEFNYNKYWRLGERTESMKKPGWCKERLSLPQNWYSYTGYHHYNNGRYHFLPIWYPDGSYKPYANVYDCWTPSGELRVKIMGEIRCRGSLWEDWYVKVDR